MKSSQLHSEARLRAPEIVDLESTPDASRIPARGRVRRVARSPARLVGSLRRRPALVLVLLSLFGWMTWYFARGPSHPCGDLSEGYYSDHFSHLNTVRLFFKVGTAIYKRPTRELGHAYSE